MNGEVMRLENVKVHIDKVVFMPHISDPPERPYGFVYYITIENKSPHTIQILGRKWIVRELSGKTVVVEGQGVVGETPILKPNDSFSYNSCHVVGSDSVAYGSFFGMIQRKDKPFVTAIPEFHLEVPV